MNGKFSVRRGRKPRLFKSDESNASDLSKKPTSDSSKKPTWLLLDKNLDVNHGENLFQDIVGIEFEKEPIFFVRRALMQAFYSMNHLYDKSFFDFINKFYLLSPSRYLFNPIDKIIPIYFQTDISIEKNLNQCLESYQYMNDIFLFVDLTFIFNFSSIKKCYYTSLNEFKIYFTDTTNISISPGSIKNIVVEYNISSGVNYVYREYTEYHVTTMQHIAKKMRERFRK